MTTTATYTATGTFIGTCAWAGHRFLAERKPIARMTNCPDCAPVESVCNGSVWVQRSVVEWVGIKARHSTRKCNGTCTSAKSAKCVCACDGRNHGRDIAQVI